MTPAVVALRRAGIEFELVEYEHDPSAASYGLEAVEALGRPPESIFKTLVAEVDGRLVVGMVPVDSKLDLKALASAAGGKRASMADVADAERVTGYVVGGISPLGQRTRLPMVVDESIEELETVCVSAGRRGVEICLAPADLIALTAALVGPIAG